MKTKGGQDVVFSKYGGHGVDIGLSDRVSDGRVFWSRYETAGGFKMSDSYVVVESEHGRFRTAGGTRVVLLSINGIGEVRWSVSLLSQGEGDKQAIEWFGLTAAPKDKE